MRDDAWWVGGGKTEPASEMMNTEEIDGHTLLTTS